MRVERLAEALRGLGFEPVLTSGQLAYRTVADDGTPVLHRVARPSDLGDEVMQRIRDALPPEDARALRRPEVIAVLRGMASDLPTSSPWEVPPDPEAVGIYLNSPHDWGVWGFNRAGPSLLRAIISQLMTRQRRPRARAPVLTVLARRDQWPAVMTTLSNLCAGRVHEYGPGHGQPSPDCLVTVYHATPDDDARGAFWTEVRGDRRGFVPVPVVLAEWGEWQAWQDWLMASRPASDTMPPMWAYYAGDVSPLSRRDCGAYWAGAVALMTAGQSLAIRLPKTMRPSEGSLAAVNKAVRQVLRYMADEDGVDSDDDPPRRSDACGRPPRAVSSGSSPP